MLKAKGITTLILAGWKVSGSVTYTSVGATLRGYTVVVPVDASLDATDYEIAIGQYPDFKSAQRESENERLKSWGFDAQPHGFDHVQIAFQSFIDKTWRPQGI